MEIGKNNNKMILEKIKCKNACWSPGKSFKLDREFASVSRRLK